MEWNKTSITLPYSYENLKTLLEVVCKSENSFPQVDFCMRCDNLTTAWLDGELNDEDEQAYHVAQMIECQWDLHWYELYSHEQLMKMELSQLELPVDLFKEWAMELAKK